MTFTYFLNVRDLESRPNVNISQMVTDIAYITIANTVSRILASIGIFTFDLGSF